MHPTVIFLIRPVFIAVSFSLNLQSNTFYSTTEEIGVVPLVNLCSCLYFFSSVWFFVESSACNFSVACTHRTFLELHNPLPSSINQPQPSCHLQNVWPEETERRLWIRLQKLTNNERRRFASTLMAGQSPNPNKGSERSANSRRVVKFWAGFKFERVSHISP